MLPLRAAIGLPGRGVPLPHKRRPCHIYNKVSKVNLVDEKKNTVISVYSSTLSIEAAAKAASIGYQDCLRILLDPEASRAVDEAIRRRIKGMRVDRDWVKARLAIMADASLLENDKQSALKALEMLGRMEGAFVDKQTVDVRRSVDYIEVVPADAGASDTDGS